MTYRERRLARAERLRGWAETRQQRATAQLNSQPELRHDWAFITQPGHIPERARMNARDDRAYASLAKAGDMARRADGIEHAAERAIYSDDPDAVEQLRAKLAELEAERKRWTDYNAACRKAGSATAEALAILDDAQRADLLSLARVASWQIRANGAAPAYLTSNLGGNIKRTRDRLAQLTARYVAPRVHAECPKCDAGEWAEHHEAPQRPPAPAGYEADPSRYACPDGPYCADPDCIAVAGDWRPGMTAATLPRPRVAIHGPRVYLSCHRGHYLASIESREWAGSNIESMAGLPERCADCASPDVRPAPTLRDIAGDRNATIATLREALKRRTGRAWSVTGGRGTSWGWIKVDAPPARATWSHRLRADATSDRPDDYEPFDTGLPGRSMSPDDRAELGRVLGFDRPAHPQGESIPASTDYRLAYIERALGRPVTVDPQPYWD